MLIMRRFRRALAPVVAALAAVSLIGALAPHAAAAPQARTLSGPLTLFSVPTVSGLEFGPGGVPGGSFRPLSVSVAPAPSTRQFPPPPPAVVFRVDRLAPFYYQYAYRYLRVDWRNLRTGATGSVELRHWRLPGDYEVPGHPASLPTSAIARTGAGPVVATLTSLREQYRAPAMPISIIPGLTVVQVGG